MLDFSLPFPELALELFYEQLKLEKFANLSILDATDERDQYLTESLQFVLDSCIDTVNGGFYIFEDQQYNYFTLSNAVFACWLLSAGRALYSGELIQYGKLMIESLEKYLWNDEAESFHKALNFKLASAPFMIKRSKLKSDLSDDEFKLLEGYLNSKIETELVNCQFKNRLVDAAKFSGLLLKQAQILDGSLRFKLQKMTESTLSKGIISEGLSFEEVIQVFSCMTQSLLWHKRDLNLGIYSKIAELVKTELRIENKSRKNIEIQILQVFSLLESFQLKWDDTCYQKILSQNFLMWEESFDGFSEYSKVLRTQVISILKEISNLEHLSIQKVSLPKLEKLIAEDSDYELKVFSKGVSGAEFSENYRKLAWDLNPD